MTDPGATLRLLTDGVRLLDAGHVVAARVSIMTALERMAAAELSPEETVQAARLAELQRQCEEGVNALLEVREAIQRVEAMALMAAHGTAGHA